MNSRSNDRGWICISDNNRPGNLSLRICSCDLIQVEAAFEKFSKKVEEVDALIKSRNADPSLKNRNGPTKVPYELLRPTSGSGLTNRGIPNSVSI